MNKLLYDLFVFLCVYLDTLCYSMNLVFDELTAQAPQVDNKAIVSR